MNIGKKILSFFVFFVFLLFISTDKVFATFGSEVAADGAISHWNFEEASGNLLDQISSNDGTVVVGDPDRQISGEVGSANNFVPGSFDAFRFTDDTFDSLSQGAIEAIISIDSDSGDYTIFSSGSETSSRPVVDFGVSDGRLKLNILDSDDGTFGDSLNMIGATKLKPNTWYHVVAEVSNTTGAHLYLNGKEDTNYTLYSNSLQTNTEWFSDVDIGAGTNYVIGFRDVSSNSGWYDGKIDELAIYDAPKSVSVWKSHYEASIASEQITLTKPYDYQVIQRNGSNQTDISINGYYTGSPAGIEARWSNGSWTAMTLDNSNYTFSGTLSNQSVGQGSLEVRFTDNTSVNDTSAYVGVGDVFVIAGQSNGAGRGTNTQAYSHATLKASLYGNDGIWKELVDPTDNDGSSSTLAPVAYDVTRIGSVWPLLATHYLANEEIPVAFIPAAKGSTYQTEWVRSSGDPDDNTTLYGAMYNKIMSQSNGVKAVLFWQGEAEVGNDTSKSTYRTALELFANNIYSDFGVKTGIAQVVALEITGSRTEDNLNNIRLAEQEAWINNNNVFAGPVLYDINLTDNGGDGTHIKDDDELQIAADRWWVALEKTFLNGLDGRGPLLTAAEYNLTKDQIRFTFSDNTFPLLPTTGIGGFTIKDDGTPVGISSVTRTATNQITATLSSMASGIITASFASGNDGQDVSVITDSSTYNLPVEIFIDQLTTVLDETAPAIFNLISPTSYTKDNTSPAFYFKKSSDSNGISSYSVSLDYDKDRNYIVSGIPTSGNGTANYIWKEDGYVRIEFLNEEDSDSTNDEIRVYFKGLSDRGLTEGKHIWKVTAYDSESNFTTQSADFFIDKTTLLISDLTIANVASVLEGTTYNLDLTNRMPSFSGLVYDLYKGSTVQNDDGSEDTFDKVASGPKKVILTMGRLQDGQSTTAIDPIYDEYLTQEYDLTDIENLINDKKQSRFYITTPFPLIDGYYKVQMSLRDEAVNNYDQPVFYLSLNRGSLGGLTIIEFDQSDKNLKTEIIEQKTILIEIDEEKEIVEEEGYKVEVKVVDKDNNPVSGAKVTIHSKVQETISDKDGLARFSNVEKGDHRVIIAYDDFEGEQKINLTGDVKQFDLTVQVEETGLFSNNIEKVILLISILTIIGLMAFMYKSKKYN